MCVCVCVANKHNRVWTSAQPLAPELCLDIENGVVNAYQDKKERAMILREKYDWDKNDTMKNLWAFGHTDDIAANVFINSTQGVSHIQEVKGNRTVVLLFVGLLTPTRWIAGCRRRCGRLP